MIGSEATDAGDERAVMVLGGPAAIVLGLVLLASGAASLTLQITWQRVIALHAGLDLVSSTTVVAAFLGGLGVGSVVGGRIADRVDARSALHVLAAAEMGVAGYALVSTWILHDLYQSQARHLASPLATFAFNAVALMIPTVLLGLSLPLAARAVTDRLEVAGSRVGWCNAANTLGAALGASVATAHVVGTYGLVGATRVAAGTQILTAVAAAAVATTLAPPSTVRRVARGALIAAASLVTMVVGWYLLNRLGLRAGWRRPLAERVVLGASVAVAVGVFVPWAAPRGRPVESSSDLDPDPRSVEAAVSTSPARTWYLVYALTGAVALGFEQAFFRLIDGVVRSNTYTFGQVLALYLGFFALGTAAGSWAVRRVADRRRWFVRLQAGVAVSAVTGVLFLMHGLPALGLADRMADWYASDGLASGLSLDRADLVLFWLVVPSILMGPPVMLMGAGFPFVHSLVTRDLESVGRGTGGVVAANLAGNVAGTLLAGFVLIDRFGVMGTYVVLAIPVGAVAVMVSGLGDRRRRDVVGAVATVVVLLVAVAALPSNRELWAELNASAAENVVVAEDRTCAAVLKTFGGDDGSQLTLNGSPQNGHPFDDFHILIGLVPALAHPDPEAALAVGFGAGSTSFALLASERVDRVTSVELCRGTFTIADELARRGVADFERLARDPRHEVVVGDGRKHLVLTDRAYQVIVPDHSRTTSAGAGNLFSREFMQLMSDRLSDDGIAASWIPTYRVQNAVATTFPYVSALTVESYNQSRFFLASRRPIELDPAVLVERFDRFAAAGFQEPQRSVLREFLATIEPECINDGEIAPRPAADLENTDLFPRDEYFLHFGGAGETQTTRTCGP